MSGSSFLNLAYMIELSVVFSLAFRELKFGELHDEVDKTVRSLISEVNSTYAGLLTEEHKDVIQEYKILTNLIDTKIKNNNNHDISLWQNEMLGDFESLIIRSFYFNFIKNKFSLRFVKYSIVINIIMVCIFTFDSRYNIQLPHELEDKVWWGCFSVLFVITAMPIWFIQMASCCKITLLGENKNGNLYNCQTRFITTMDIILENFKPNGSNSPTSSLQKVVMSKQMRNMDPDDNSPDDNSPDD
jgi:hypothetical protein